MLHDPWPKLGKLGRLLGVARGQNRLFESPQAFANVVGQLPGGAAAERHDVQCTPVFGAGFRLLQELVDQALTIFDAAHCGCEDREIRISGRECAVDGLSQRLLILEGSSGEVRAEPIVGKLHLVLAPSTQHATALLERREDFFRVSAVELVDLAQACLDLPAGTLEVQDRCPFAHHELGNAREQADLLVGIEAAERRHQAIEPFFLQPMLIQPVDELFADLGIELIGTV